jgi:putative RNA 2'-phosphotransferase
MNPDQTTHLSKFLSLVLRHQPHTAGITLDEAGWTSVDELLIGLAHAGKPVTRAELDHVVITNAKKRFEFNTDDTMIRASQGHSVEVDLHYKPQIPPTELYHGTASRFLDGIRSQGLLKQERHHVHLSAEKATALNVGSRHGTPVLLTIQAERMHHAKIPFFLSTNGVWLAKSVPAEFIVFP